MSFNNKPNHFLRDENKKIHWISRSTGVAVLVLWNSRILIVKRGPKVSKSGLWSLPGGYLDWNETASECCIREIHEECGIDIRDYRFNPRSIEVPYEVLTDPKANADQDIVLHYAIELRAPSMPEINFSIVDGGESLDVRWISVHDVSKYDFAFGHGKRILKYFGA